MIKSTIMAFAFASTSAMAADLDYYDDVPRAITGPPAVVKVNPIPVPGVSVPLPIAPPLPAVPILPACGPEGVGSLQIVGNLRSWPPADALT